MISLSDSLQHAALRLRDEYGIDLGLEGLAAQLGSTPSQELVRDTSQELRRRQRGLTTAKAYLSRLQAAARYFEKIWRFTEVGWPERREELRRLLLQDSSGLSIWLAEWYEAARQVRTDALDRLVKSDLPIPPEGRLLVDRARVAAAGLADRVWDLAAPMLYAGANGVEIQSEVVPGPQVRSGLKLLLARLAVNAGRVEDAMPLLVNIEMPEDNCVARVLEARIARLRGDNEEAAQLLGQAKASDPANLDVVAATIAALGDEPGEEAALDSARRAIDALDTLVDVDADLDRLLSDPPVELWLAVAERAIREDDRDVALRALDRAEAVIPTDKYAVLASIAELRAEVPGASKSEQADALADAGNYRSWAGQPERARTNYEQAMDVVPDHTAAMLGLADALVILSYGQPLAQTAPDLRHAIGYVLKVRSDAKITPENSWAYLSEASAWIDLSRMAEAGRSEQRWRALLANARAVAYNPDSPDRWQSLAEVMEDAGLWKAGLATASHYAQLVDPSASRAQRGRALANIGYWSELSDCLGDSSEDWADAMRGFAAVRQGAWEKARDLLVGFATREPAWLWAHEDLVTALILGHHEQEGIESAQSLLAKATKRLDEYDYLASSAFASIVCGKPGQAQEWAERLLIADPGSPGEASGAELLARARLAQRDSDGAMAALRRMVEATRSHRRVADWEPVGKPWLYWVAAQAGVTLPDLSPIDQGLQERGGKIQSMSATEEVEMNAAGLRDRDLLRLAKPLVIAIVHLATDEADAALKEVQTASAALPPTLQPELEQLEGYLKNAVASRKSSIQASTVPEVTEGSVALNSSASSAGTQLIRLELPGSWFQGHEDPLRDHELFLLQLPAIRVLTEGKVPAVHVTTDDQLEPDGYRIFIAEKFVRGGSVSREWRYVGEQGVQLLPGSIRLLAEADLNTMLLRIPAGKVLEAGPLASLLTMPAEEVIVRFIADSVAAQPAAAELRAVRVPDPAIR